MEYCDWLEQHTSERDRLALIKYLLTYLLTYSALLYTCSVKAFIDILFRLFVARILCKINGVWRRQGELNAEASFYEFVYYRVLPVI